MEAMFKVAVALALAAGLGSAAHANSRFTAENQGLGASIKIYVYNGDDKVCTSKLKSITVSDGKTESAGCLGGGTQSCKIQVARKDGNGAWICGNLKNTCSSSAIRIDNGATLTVDKNANCTITEKQ